MGREKLKEEEILRQLHGKKEPRDDNNRLNLVAQRKHFMDSIDPTQGDHHFTPHTPLVRLDYLLFSGGFQPTRQNTFRVIAIDARRTVHPIRYLSDSSIASLVISQSLIQLTFALQPPLRPPPISGKMHDMLRNLPRTKEFLE